MNILTILRDYFPGLIPIFRHLLYRFERVPSLPQEKPARINIGQVSFLWWIRTRKDWWMASKDYAEIEQLIILLKPSSQFEIAVSGISAPHKGFTPLLRLLQEHQKLYLSNPMNPPLRHW